MKTTWFLSMIFASILGAQMVVSVPAGPSATPHATGVIVAVGDVVSITCPDTPQYALSGSFPLVGPNAGGPWYGLNQASTYELPLVVQAGLIGSIGYSPWINGSGWLIDDGQDVHPVTGRSGLQDGVPGGYGPGFVGSATTFTAPVAGEIFLAINDDNYQDNIGTATVSIRVCSPQAAIGQANSTTARLEINGLGAGSQPGPFVVCTAPLQPLTFAWQGAPLMPIILVTGPMNPSPFTLPGFGTIDLGTPPLFNDVLVVFDGANMSGGLQLTTSPTGTASQTVIVPAGTPPGTQIAVQGIVEQVAGTTTYGNLLTAAFRIDVP